MSQENDAPDSLGLNTSEALTGQRYYVYQNPHTNNMEVLIPCVNDEAEILKDLPKVDGQPVTYKIVDQLPQKYFESYDLTDNEVIQSRAKLHNLKKAEWRRVRAPLLEKYDVSFMRALENGDTAEINRIRNIKQQLRDVTSYNVDNLTNSQLEELTPTILLIV